MEIILGCGGIVLPALSSPLPTSQLESLQSIRHRETSGGVSCLEVGYSGLTFPRQCLSVLVCISEPCVTRHVPSVPGQSWWEPRLVTSAGAAGENYCREFPRALYSLQQMKSNEVVIKLGR